MQGTTDTARGPARGADIMAVALGTTVAIWLVMYVAAFPRESPPTWLVPGAGGLICGLLLCAGWVSGRSAGRGPAGGAGEGLAITGLNLLVRLSLVGPQAREHGGRAAGFIGAFGAAAVILGAAGAWIGRRRREPGAEPNWSVALARITYVAALGMIVAGGLVTGLEAGLAVEGWLMPEGHLLVLFPLELMQRNVGTYVEHAHRLWGLLVGLSTIMLAVHAWTADGRRGVKMLSLAIVAAVIVQGVLGGTRVTERSVPLGIAHGVFAHVVLAMIALVAAAMTTSWRRGPDANASIATTAPAPAPGNATDRTVGLVLIAAVLLQIALGTAYRHLESLPDAPRGALMGLLHGHSFIGSALVAVLAIFCGVRAWGRHRDIPPIRSKGMGLMHGVGLQIILGFAAFFVVPKGARLAGEAIPPLEVVITTAHQATGALLLTLAVLLAAWTRRLLVAC